MAEYYEANDYSKPGSGYSHKFDGKAYRSFHGHDKYQQYDAMFYFAAAVLGKSSDEFPALLTYQPSILDQGYYHVDMTCTSAIQAGR